MTHWEKYYQKKWTWGIELAPLPTIVIGLGDQG